MKRESEIARHIHFCTISAREARVGPVSLNDARTERLRYSAKKQCFAGVMASMKSFQTAAFLLIRHVIGFRR